MSEIELKPMEERDLEALTPNVSTRGKGYGQKVWQLIEARYPDTKKWKTDTPGYSKRNHYFYVVKCGFKIVDIQNPREPFRSTYIFEKEMATRV